MTWAISTPRDVWMRQAKDAWAALEPQAPKGSQVRDLAAIDHHHFARLIEALAALTPGQVSQELQDLAGLRPWARSWGCPTGATQPATTPTHGTGRRDTRWTPLT